MVTICCFDARHVDCDHQRYFIILHDSVCVQDKTFGLKNKKGAKQQKYIKNVTQQVKYGQQSARQAAQADAEKGSKKNDKKKELDELNELFKPVVAAQKVSKGNLNEILN